MRIFKEDNDGDTTNHLQERAEAPRDNAIYDANSRPSNHSCANKSGGEAPKRSLSPLRARRSTSNSNQTRTFAGSDKIILDSSTEGLEYSRGSGAEEREEDDSEEEVLTIWPEGNYLVIERTKGGCGPCADVEVEVLHGAATTATAISDPALLAGGRGATSNVKARRRDKNNSGSNSGSNGGKLRKRVYARKCALQARVEEIKSDLAKRI